MKKIVILHSDVSPDATEDELDCLKQAETIAQALHRLDYEPMFFPFGLDLNQTIKKLKFLKPQAVFNIAETLAAKGSLIYFAPAILDILQIPYTGCGTQAMFQTSNKPLAKKIMYDARIATPAWVTQENFSSQTTPANIYLIKSSWEHASIGLDEDSLISYTNKENLLKEMNRRKEKLGGSCYAEAYIEGREFSIALIADKLGVRVLPAVEMLFRDYAPDKPKLVDYKAKWVADSFEYNNTIQKFDFNETDANLISTLHEIALRCWYLFGLRGYARVDFRVDNNGKPWVLEINANPCLSLDAGFAAALDRAQIQYHEAIELIINDALQSLI
jgi:D-alanine-D-alanine ligase